ncbi:hypothetical protein SAMN02910358_01293 [Lachnospiraceae bacterium XBB1006]|nr:hypothetical protein SAMN02910358_01293 [Lachnospiraceae bacterium XBB1006]
MKTVIRVLQISICIVAVCVLTSCGNGNIGTGDVNGKDRPDATTSESNKKGDNVAAEGYDYFGGQIWEVGGVCYGDNVVDVHDHDTLADLYDVNFLGFNSDGSYMHYYVFPTRGKYKTYEAESGQNCFLLNTEVTLKLDHEKGELIEDTSENNKSYIITLLDDNTFKFAEFDSFSGKAKANTEPLIFVKSGEKSQWIADNKTEIFQNYRSDSKVDSNAGTSKNDGRNNLVEDATYQSIYDDYTDKMEKAVPGLVRAYRSEASGVADINRLAEICNTKISSLAKICTAGMEKMARLMYASGDDYETYEGWATELQETYNDLAQEIMDEYLDSAN